MDFLDGAFAQHLVHYGYGAIFLIVMMESAGIPAPGETILVSAAVYAGTRHALDIRFVIGAAAAGAIVGAISASGLVGNSASHCSKNGVISSGLMPEREAWAGFSSTAMAERSCSSGASLRCCVHSPRYSRVRTDSRPGASLSSMRPAELFGRRYSEPAVTCSAKA
jgi:hypothetical protein